MYGLFNRRSLIALTAALLVVAGAKAQNAYDVEGGRTTVTLSSDLLTALSDLKVTPGTAIPTQLADGKVNFPITSGVIDLETAKIQLLHSGGLTFTAGNDGVEIGNFVIDTTGAIPQITGTVAANGKLLGRIALFQLVLPNGIRIPLSPSDGGLKLSGVKVELTAGAAAVLNAVFHVTAFKGNFVIGTAEVNALLPWNAR
jgi:hypothetical protein